MAQSPALSSNEPNEFFVGWLSMPPGYGRFLKAIAVVFLLVSGGAALLVGLSQQSPGSAEWDVDKQVTFQGVAYAAPYALIRVRGDSQEVPVRTIFLVEEGKFGAT
jgi:hypothetical protein